MSVFVYDPASAKSWSSKVVNYLNGGSDSIAACSAKFREQIAKLVQPNVWTGAAAAKNYENFMTTHQALISFINQFGNAFQQAMTSVNQQITELEAANLGTDTNVSASFGTLTYNQIAELSEQNINKEIVTYDYATITGIGTALNSIKATLDSVDQGLHSTIEVLNNGSKVWDGDAAQAAKESLLNTLTTNMKQIKDNLDTCISNISTAAQAAQGVDQG